MSNDNKKESLESLWGMIRLRNLCHSNQINNYLSRMAVAQQIGTNMEPW